MLGKGEEETRPEGRANAGLHELRKRFGPRGFSRRLSSRGVAFSAAGH